MLFNLLAGEPVFSSSVKQRYPHFFSQLASAAQGFLLICHRRLPKLSSYSLGPGSGLRSSRWLNETQRSRRINVSLRKSRIRQQRAMKRSEEQLFKEFLEWKSRQKDKR